MSIHLQHLVLIQASRDADGKQKLFWGDEVADAVSLDSLDKLSTSLVSVAPLGVDTMTFGDIASVRGMSLEVSGACTVKLNGGAQVISLAPSAADGTKARLFLEGAITGLEITNPSATAVLTGVLVAWGDLTV
jgi:hypothetical protein